MNWLDKRTSLYKCLADNTGDPATFRQILFSRFAEPHKWYYSTGPKQWINSEGNDVDTLIEIRKLNPEINEEKAEQTLLKMRLQCFTPSALLETKKHGMVKEIERTSIIQLDFDFKELSDYDITELKQCFFDLPFVCFAGLSCSGRGFYILALIAEPEKQEQYVEHCFTILGDMYGIKADTSKGKKVSDLRYVSYDANMLVKDNPEPLLIKKFYKKPVVTQPKISAKIGAANHSRLIKAQLNKISMAVSGNRWQTVQQTAYTLGGLNNPGLLKLIQSQINSNPEFTGSEAKYYKCAEDCFAAGSQKLIANG